MKIFFVASDIPFPGFTGASVVNWSIVNYLINKGHKITIFSDNPRYGFSEIDKEILEKMHKKIKTINCEFVSLNSVKINIRKKNFFQRIISNKDEDYFPECNSSKEIESIIFKHFKKIKPDIILCYGYAAISFVKNINCIKAGWCESKFGVAFSAIQNEFIINQFFVKIIKLIKLYFFQKKMIKEFNKINYRFLHSKDYASDQIKAGAISCEHLLPPIYDAREIFLKKNKKIQETETYFKVLIVGLMSNVNISQVNVLRKHVFPVIEKNKLTKKIKFHFVGINNDNLPNDFKNKDYVIARGYVEDIYTELNNSDLLFSVTPKRFGFRVRLAEALSFGTCILTTKFDQLSLPFLKDNFNCYIVDDIKNTGNKILEIFKNQARNNHIKYNARKAYEENLSYEVAGKNFEKFINIVK